MRLKPSLILTGGLLGYLLGTWVISCSALFAYDCSGRGAKTIAVDLSNPEECDEPETYYHSPEDLNIQLMAVELDRQVSGYQCQVSVSAEVSRCGYDSIHYGSHKPLVNVPVNVTTQQCWRMAKEGTYQYWDRTFGVVLAENQVRQFYSRGNLDNKGNCEVETFHTAGLLFAKHYEKRTLNIDVRKIRGVLDKSTNNVIISGVRGSYESGSFQDDNLGTVVWRPRTPECHESVSQIYLGSAKIHRHRNGTIGSFVMLANNDTRQYGGFRLTATTSICNVQGYTTQVEGLVIRILRNGDEPLDHTKFRNSLKFTELNLLSKMAYLHLRTNSNMELQFSMVYSELCSTRRESVLNRMRMMAYTNNQYVAIDLFGMGHTMSSRGAVAYVTRCEKIPAKIRSIQNCTLDIPASYGSNYTRSGYIDPISFIIKSHSHILPCDPISPVSWNLDGQWWCSSPELRACPTPMKIDVVTDSQQLLRDYASETGEDMFSEEQHASHEAYMLSQNSREPILTDLAFKSSVNGEPGEPAGVPISADEVEVLSRLIGANISPAFYYFGKTYFIIWILLTVYGLFKIVFDCVTRVYIALRTGQGSLGKILRVIIHSSFLFLMFPAHVLVAAVNQGVNPGEPEERQEKPGVRNQESDDSTNGNKYETPPKQKPTSDRPQGSAPRRPSAGDPSELIY